MVEEWIKAAEDSRHTASAAVYLSSGGGSGST